MAVVSLVSCVSQSETMYQKWTSSKTNDALISMRLSYSWSWANSHELYHRLCIELQPEISCSAWAHWRRVRGHAWIIPLTCRLAPVAIVMTEARPAFSVRRLDHLPFRNIGPTREAEPLFKIASRCPVGLNPFCPWRYPGDFCNRRAAGAIRWRSRMSH